MNEMNIQRLETIDFNERLELWDLVDSVFAFSPFIRVLPGGHKPFDVS